MKDRQERERALDRLLPDVLSEAPSGASACVDGEALAAWASGHLRSDEAARVEAHLSGCAHCQGVLGTFVRSAPPAPPASVWSRWQLRWLVPLATAATVVTVYLLGPGLDTSPRPEDTFILSDARRDVPAVAAEPDAARQAATAPAPAAATPAAPAPLIAPPAALTAPPAPRAQSAEERTRPRTLEAERNELDQRTSTDRPARQTDASRSASPEPPAQTTEAKLARPQARDTAAVAPRQEVALAEPLARPSPAPPAASPAAPPPPAVGSAPAKPAAAAPATVGGATGAMERRAEAALSVRRQVGVNVDIATPLPTHRFRIVDGQRVERTTTGGERWEPVTRPVAGEMTAGAAPAADICWIVGPLGAVWRTLDGQTLVRIPFPQPLDLLAVAAESATVAVVTASNGRTFRTTDGGQSWQ